MVGENEEEGYFARFLYQYVINPQQYGGIRLDLTSKLGPGLGIDHFYNFAHNYGEVFLYGRQGLEESVMRVDHTQQLPGNVIFDLTSDVRKNSEFTQQDTTTTNISASFHRTGDDNSELLNYTQDESLSNYLSNNISANLRYNLHQSWGTMQYSEEYSSFAYTATGTGEGTAPATNTLWIRLQLLDHSSFGDFNFRVDHRNQLKRAGYGRAKPVCRRTTPAGIISGIHPIPARDELALRGAKSFYGRVGHV